MRSEKLIFFFIFAQNTYRHTLLDILRPIQLGQNKGCIFLPDGSGLSPTPGSPSQLMANSAVNSKAVPRPQLTVTKCKCAKYVWQVKSNTNHQNQNMKKTQPNHRRKSLSFFFWKIRFSLSVCQAVGAELSKVFVDDFALSKASVDLCALSQI